MRQGRSWRTLRLCGHAEEARVWKFFCDCFDKGLTVGEVKTALIELPERAACLALRRTEGEIVGGVFWVSPEITPHDFDLPRLLLRLFTLQVNATSEADQKEPQKLVHAPDFPPATSSGAPRQSTCRTRSCGCCAAGPSPS